MNFSRKSAYIIAINILSVLLFINPLASENKKKTLKRTMDPVTITGVKCLNVIGKSIANYRLYSFQNNKHRAIPFQIDEVNKKGDYVLTGGKEKSQDNDKGHFDANDQLVFMSRDTGDGVTKKKIFPGNALGCIEISIIDPVTNEKGWVYLMTFNNTPPTSTIDYVNYEPKNLKIVAWNYITQFDKNHPIVARKHAFWKKIGGDGTDLIDRVKTRINMKILFTINRTEDDVKVEEFGYIDGPIRVIIHTRNTTPLFLGIPASRTIQDTFYYYAYSNLPCIVDLPVVPSRFHVLIYDDFINCKGWTFYSSTNPDGHVIDGVMDDSDKQLKLSPYKWSVISNKKFAFWTRCIYPQDSPVKPYLYYNDDVIPEVLPEEITGEFPGIGFEFKEGWEDVSEYPMEYRILHFYSKGYVKGDEKNIVNVHDNPLKVSVKSIF